MFFKRSNISSLFLIFSIFLISKLAALPTPYAWEQVSPAPSPSARQTASMAFDGATGQLILFGGVDINGNLLDDTWNWDGNTWTQLTPLISPPARAQAAMAFDQRTGQLILFGGFNGGTLGDTWRWDGQLNTWIPVPVSNAPLPRRDASMAFDANSGNLILFGGIGNQTFNDTWSWNGITWTQVASTGPSARFNASLAQDPATGQLILFGGTFQSATAPPVFFNDTWNWNGSAWVQISTPSLNTPPGRESATLTFSGTGQLIPFGTPHTNQTGLLILFGGDNQNGTLGDTWAWNGSAWAQLEFPPGAQIPPVRRGATMAFDEATGQMVLFGGAQFNGAQVNFLNDTWIWSNPCPNTPLDWTQLLPAASPPARDSASMAQDPASGQVILFGGENNIGNFNDTWNWNGSNWVQITTAHSPTPRSGAAMAFDSAGHLILFGGINIEGGGFLGDTWSWNGSDWTQLSPTTSPPARSYATMAFDQATGQLILFGGFNSAHKPSLFQDTWRWNGTTWVQLSPTTSPPARQGAAMAYDPATGQLILFGGRSSGALNDTWNWTGSNWVLLTPTTSPSPRVGPSMAYDSSTGQLILFGGNSKAGLLNDTWNWTGNTWTQLSPNTSPPARNFASMAYDPNSGHLILFGGASARGEFGDTWAWGFPVPLVTGISPDRGPSTGGTPVTITGTNFLCDPVVLFGPSPAGIFSSSPTQLLVQSPSGLAGPVQVTVSTPGGTSAALPSDVFLFVGGEPTPPENLFPPEHVRGHQTKNRFATQTDIINILTWRAPSRGIPPVKYQIFRDAALTHLVATLPADAQSKFKFKDHNRREHKTYTYYLVSVNAENRHSTPVVVTIEPQSRR